MMGLVAGIVIGIILGTLYGTPIITSTLIEYNDDLYDENIKLKEEVNDLKKKQKKERRERFLD